MLITKVKPDMVREFESLQKDINDAYKKAGVPSRTVVQTAVFGETNEYVSIAPIEKFAQFDGPSPLVKALGEEGSRELLGRIGKCVLESHRSAVRARDDLSLRSAAVDPTQIAVVTTIHVATGRGPDFAALLKKDILPALKKAGIENYWVSETVFGGNAGDWTAVTLYKNFAELDSPPPLVRALGQQGFDRLLAKSAGIVSSITRSIAKLRLDLSFAPMPAK